MAGHGGMVSVHHLEKLAGTVEKSRRRAHGHQGVHVGGPFQQTAEAVDKEFLVHHHHQAGQQKLVQAGGSGVFQKVRDRPAPHGMPHGHIHEGEQEDHTHNEPQTDPFPLPCVILGRGSRFGFLDRGCPVTCLLNGLADGLRCGGGREFHPHGVGQQAHRHGLHPGQGRNHLLHPGRAGGAAHARYVESFHRMPPFQIPS